MITSAKQRALIHERATEMNEKAGLQKRGFTAQETRDFDDLMLDIKEWDERQTFTPTSGSSFGSTGSGKQEARFYTSDSESTTTRTRSAPTPPASSRTSEAAGWATTKRWNVSRATPPHAARRPARAT
jgi:hypothetical protein